MRVLFFIYSHSQLSGGHNHSLNQISSHLAKDVEVFVCSIGKSESPVISGNSYYNRHIFTRGILFYFSFRKEFNKTIKELEPDIIHFFDTESLNLALLANSLANYPVVMNKCGGPNPHRVKWQQADQIVLFSFENFNWFKNNPYYRESQIHLVPNRVTPLKEPERRHIELKDENKLNFMRISRLGSAYEITLLNTFNLIERLMASYPVNLYVVGRIQNDEKFQFLKSNAEKRQLPVVFITDERASKASDFLYLADVVVGTGRSLMEASSLGIPCLTPVVGMSEPVLVTESNFQSLFKTNFSERNELSIEDREINKTNIQHLIEDKDYYNSTSKKMKELFESHFSLSNSSEKYLSVYQQALDNGVTLNKRWKNILYLIRLIGRF